MHREVGFFSPGAPPTIMSADPAILDWLTPVDFRSLVGDHLSHQQPGTSQWLIDSAEFKTWVNTPGRTLFCWGPPGAGKTVLSSFVVNFLGQRVPTDDGSHVGIAYLFFRFNVKVEQVEQHFVSTCLKQLAQDQKSTTLPALQALYYRHHVAGSSPSTSELLIVLQSMIRLYDRVFIVVDALDECSSRERLLAIMSQLQRGFKVNFFTTSRNKTDTDSWLPRDVHILKMKAGEDDIRQYVEYRLAQTRIPFGDAEMRHEIIDAIYKRAGGS